MLKNRIASRNFCASSKNAERATNFNKAFAIVEILLAMTIFALFSVGVFYLSLDTLQRDSKIELDSKALAYAQEGLEAIRNMRDRNYLALTNGDHGLQFTNDTWSFIAAPENIENFYERTVTIEDVYRDGTGAIASEGTFDSDTKKVTSEIVWNMREIFPRTIVLVAYVSNWTGDDWIQTICTEFSQGSFSNTNTTETASPPTNNCALELTEVESASEFFKSVNVGKHGNDVVVDGNYAYLAVDETSKGLAVINISDPATPTIISQKNVWGKGRYIAKSGNNVYMGIQVRNPAIVIANVSNPSNPNPTYAWELSGYGNQPAVSGNYLYMAVDEDDNSFRAYVLSPVPTMTDYLDFDDEVHVITINNDYAYAGIDEDDEGFQVVDISDPYNLRKVNDLDVGEEVNAITIMGTYAYVGTEDSDESLQVVSIFDPENPSVLTSLNVGGEIEDLVISGDYLYAAVDEQNAGLAVINISTPTTPTLAYTLDIQGKGTGIDTDGQYVYVSTNTSNKGLVIVGTTISGVVTSGNYESDAFDTGSADTRYNFIEWDHTEVPGGTVRFQIKTADTESNLTSAVWVGSDGTNSTYYEIARTSIVLDSNRSGVRFFQFKVFVTSDGTNSPLLESIRVNYTP